MIAVTPDEKEVIYVKRVLNRDRIFAYETETGMTREIDANSTYSIYTTNKDETRGIITNRPIMWYFSDLLRNISESGKLRTYNTVTKDVTLIGEDAAKDVLSISPDGAWAIATEAYNVERGTDSSTRTADVIMLSADGTEKITLIQNASMGLWDDSEDSFAGRCALRATWTSSISVAMIGCPSTTKQATLRYGCHYKNE